MDNPFQILEKLYLNCKRQEDEKKFFLSLIQFLEFVLREPIFKSFIENKLPQLQQEEDKEYFDLEKETIKKVEHWYERAIEIIDRDGIRNLTYERAITEYENAKNGVLKSSNGKTMLLIESVRGIYEAILKIKGHDFIKDNGLGEVDKTDDNRHYIKKWTFENDVNDFFRYKSYFDRKRETQISHIWNFLQDFYVVFYRIEKLRKDLSQREYDFFEASNYAYFQSDINILFENSSFRSNDKVIFFKSEDYKSYLDYFYHQLLIELSLDDNYRLTLDRSTNVTSDVKDLIHKIKIEADFLSKDLYLHFRKGKSKISLKIAEKDSKQAKLLLSFATKQSGKYIFNHQKEISQKIFNRKVHKFIASEKTINSLFSDLISGIKVKNQIINPRALINIQNSYDKSSLMFFHEPQKAIESLKACGLELEEKI